MYVDLHDVVVVCVCVDGFPGEGHVFCTPRGGGQTTK